MRIRRVAAEDLGQLCDLLGEPRGLVGQLGEPRIALGELRVALGQRCVEERNPLLGAVPVIDAIACRQSEAGS